MRPFGLRLPGRIAFGRGAFAATYPDIAGMGRRVLVVHGASAAGRARDLAAHLGQARRLCQSGEPVLDDLRGALDEARAYGPDAVVAIGGGSVIDLGKALAALLPGGADPMRHLEVVGESAPLEAAPLPFVAVPTTAGTGSEATTNAVIGVPEAVRKVSLRDDRMLARLAVVDPALLAGVPGPVRIASGLDALTQVIEPYLSSRSNPMTDALCRDAIPRGLAALRRVMAAPGGEADDDMALVSLSGGIALANAGLGAVHGLAGVIGGRTGAAHGAICGRLLVPVLRRNLAQMNGGKGADVLGWIGEAFGADAPLDRLADWIDAQGLPTPAELGWTPGDASEIAAAALDASSMKGNPVALDTDDLAAILRAA